MKKIRIIKRVYIIGNEYEVADSIAVDVANYLTKVLKPSKGSKIDWYISQSCEDQGLDAIEIIFNIELIDRDHDYKIPQLSKELKVIETQ